MAISVEYGDYSLTPAPLLNISKSYIKSANGLNVGVTFTTTLSGFLTSMDGDQGFKDIMAKQTALRAAFDEDGKYFVITCGLDVILECHPRILSIGLQESSDKWTQKIPYTIIIEYENDPVDIGGTGLGENNPGIHPEYISDFQEDWNVEFAHDESNKFSVVTGIGTDANPFLLRCTHNVSAVGKAHYIENAITGGKEIPKLEKEPWEQARDYVDGRLGFDDNKFISTGGLNLEAGEFQEYDHYRTVNTNITAGSYSVQESWVVIGKVGGAHRKALEDFSITLVTAEQDVFDTVTVEGTVRGLEERVYGASTASFAVTSNKYENALSYFNGLTATILSRAQVIVPTVNTKLLSGSVSHSYNQGTISYNRVYNTRPSNCIPSAKFESISISDKNPTDVFALITVMGRTNGPILQNFNTQTEFSRTVNIEALLALPAGCTAVQLMVMDPDEEVKDLLCGFETDLISRYNKVFKSADDVNWDPKTGRYNRSVTWTCGSCSDPAPSTSLC